MRKFIPILFLFASTLVFAADEPTRLSAEVLWQLQRVGSPVVSPDGSQVVAQLPDDDLAVDNQRYFAVRPPSAYPVLIIDESPRGDDGHT